MRNARLRRSLLAVANTVFRRPPSSPAIVLHRAQLVSIRSKGPSGDTGRRSFASMESFTVDQLHTAAQGIADRFVEEGGTNKKDIDDAIVLARAALEMCPAGHMRSVSLNQLSLHLMTRYNELDEVQDLDEAIVLSREALQLRHRSNRDHRVSLNNLGRYLSQRHSTLRRMGDLDEAIVIGRESLGLCPHGNPDRLEALGNIARYLSDRYEELGGMQDVDEAITLGREALDLCPPGHPDRGDSLGNLGTYLSSRYRKLSEMRDLDESIDLDREALGLYLHDYPLRSTSLNNLSTNLCVRFRKLRKLQDLDEAIALGRDAIKVSPQDHPDLSTYLSNLGQCLRTRYEELNKIQDLDEAIDVCREELELYPRDDPDRSHPLISLGAYLSTRYIQSRRTQDLDEAIVFCREALELCPPGHSLRPQCLRNLGVELFKRFHQLCNMQDLDEAIDLAREALELHPQGHPDRSVYLDDLVRFLSLRYDDVGKSSDLDELVVLDREILQLRPDDHPDRPASLDNLADHLSSRYKELGEIKDLEEAIVLAKEALKLRPQGHPDRSTALDNLGSYLSSRYDKLDRMEDLEEVIVVWREALELYPLGHPRRSKCLTNLAALLSSRYSSNLGKSNQAPSTSDELFSVYAQLGAPSDLVSRSDLEASVAWVRDAENFKHSSTLAAYETALQLLVEHVSILPSTPQQFDTFKRFAPSLAADAFSACLRRQLPERAVELLEQGRGLFWNQRARLSVLPSDVVASGPAGAKLADEFTRLNALIGEALRSPGEDQHLRLSRLNFERQSVVAAIRALPGLAGFLRPSSFAELQGAASGGPVIVVNASRYGCDALVLFHNQDPVHVPLSITYEDVVRLSAKFRTLTEREEGEDTSKDLCGLLHQLWNAVVAPIVDVLRPRHPSRSRIWWCPTGPFCALPLHAAGPYDSARGGENLSEVYVSSYTTTLTALVRARRTGGGSASSATSFVAIADQGHAELAEIGQRVGGAAAFEQIEGQAANVARVAEVLGKHAWVHVACDGRADRAKPFASAFDLCDGPFSVTEVLHCAPENPEFAFLSGPQTVVGDEENPDEGMHLAAAMQFIGFRSVVGTMGRVDRGADKEIVSKFYERVLDESGRLDYSRAAFALNETMRSVDAVDRRALYVHLGA